MIGGEAAEILGTDMTVLGGEEEKKGEGKSPSCDKNLLFLLSLPRMPIIACASSFGAPSEIRGRTRREKA